MKALSKIGALLVFDKNIKTSFYLAFLQVTMQTFNHLHTFTSLARMKRKYNPKQYFLIT
jgi:hypothetical protein